MKYKLNHNMILWFVKGISLILSIHFGIAIIIWLMSLYGSFIATSEEKDWSVYINAIPTVVFFIMSVLTFRFAAKKKEIAIVIILLTLSASTLCFIYETSNHRYQMQTPIHHIGSQYSYLTLGFKEHYNNWWWYKRVVRIVPEEKAEQ